MTININRKISALSKLLNTREKDFDQKNTELNDARTTLNAEIEALNGLHNELNEHISVDIKSLGSALMLQNAFGMIEQTKEKIADQTIVVNDCTNDVERCSELWRDAYKDKSVLEKVIANKRSDVKKILRVREDKQMDEISQQMHARNR